jgi:2'-5' RNA ligase
MAFAVQLDLDAGTETSLCDLANELAAIGDLRTMRRIGNVHHLTLAVYGDLPLDRFSPRLATFAEALQPMDLRLANVVIFPGVRRASEWNRKVRRTVARLDALRLIEFPPIRTAYRHVSRCRNDFESKPMPMRG